MSTRRSRRSAGRSSLQVDPSPHNVEKTIKEKIADRLSEFEKNLRCRICLSVARDATSLPCSHFFCGECLNRHFQVNGRSEAKCPLCNTEFNRRGRIADPLIRNLSLAYRQLHQLACDSLDLPLTCMSQDSGSFREQTPVKDSFKKQAILAKQREEASQVQAAIDFSEEAVNTPSVSSSRNKRGAGSENETPSATNTTKKASNSKRKSSRKRQATPKTSHMDVEGEGEADRSAASSKKRKSPSGGVSKDDGKEEEEKEEEEEEEGEEEEGDVFPLSASGFLTPATNASEGADVADAAIVQVMSPMPDLSGKVSIAEEACHVCCRTETDDGEDMGVVLCCSLCDARVHETCYGTNWKPPKNRKDWVCDVCASDTHAPHCYVCPNRDDRILKQTTDGQWIHVACAYWHAEPRFINYDTYTPVDVSAVGEERMAMKCGLCKKQGACVQCSYPRCCASYHVPCGFRKGVRFELRADAVDESKVYFHSFCLKHRDKGADVKSDNATPLKSKKSSSSKKKKGKSSSSRTKSGRKSSTSSAEKNKKKKVKRSLQTELDEEKKVQDVVLLGTGLTEEQFDLLDVLATEVGLEVVVDYCSRVTHVITGTTVEGNAQVCPKRTIKYYLGILDRKHIMCWDWVSASIKANALMPEEEYRVLGDAAGLGGIDRHKQLETVSVLLCHMLSFSHSNFSTFYYSPLTFLLAHPLSLPQCLFPHFSTSQGLLDGFIVVVHNEFKTNKVLDIRKAVRIAGGRVEKNLPFNNPDRLVLGHWVVLTETGEVKKKEKEFCLQNAIPVTQQSWLFDSISLAQVQDTNAYSVSLYS